jgi:hypothetical protein
MPYSQFEVPHAGFTLGESKMWEGSESFEQVAHVAAGEGSPTDRSRFEETLRKCAATVGIDVQQSVLIVGGSFRDAHSLYRLGFRRMTLSNVEPLADVDAKTEPMLDADITLRLCQPGEASGCRCQL